MISCHLPKADKDVKLDRYEGFQPVGHGRRFHAQQFFGNGGRHFLSRFESRAILAKEHGAVGLEMIVMAAVEGIEIDGAFAGQVFLVGDGGLAVAVNHLFVMAAENINVGRHVYEMARIGNEAAQRVTGAQGPFGVGRHLHEVDIHVEHAGMAHAVWNCHGTFEHRYGFCRISTFGGFSSLDVPELPRRTVHDGFGEEGRHIQIVFMGEIDFAHGGGVVIVPDRCDLFRVFRGIAFGQAA